MLSDELCSLNHIQNHADVAVQLLYIIIFSYIATCISSRSEGIMQPEYDKWVSGYILLSNTLGHNTDFM